jgi:CheY-like chemotaxis protein
MKKSRVLLVDDEAVVRDSVSEWLRDEEYEVECASNGTDALDAMAKRRFDTALVDLKMPGMDGIELMKKIKQDSPKTIVIIITAYGTVENAVEAIKSGASDYLTKPFTLDRLEKAIEETRQKTELLVEETTIAPPKPELKPEVELREEKTKPVVVEEGVKPTPQKQCIWAKAGIVSYRLCTRNFQCDTCEFAQTLVDTNALGGGNAMTETIKKMLEKAGPDRACRYMLSGHVSFRLCNNLYQCERCNFHQIMQEKLENETEKIAKRIKSLQEHKVKTKDMD